MNIRCRKLDCRFNQGGACHASNVGVSKNAQCKTYERDPQKDYLEFAAELTPTVPGNVPLTCQAGNCLYNHHCRCCANGISVIDHDGNAALDHASADMADCATFIER